MSWVAVAVAVPEHAQAVLNERRWNPQLRLTPFHLFQCPYCKTLTEKPGNCKNCGGPVKVKP